MVKSTHSQMPVTRSSKNPVEREAESSSERWKPVKLVDVDEDEDEVQDGDGGEPEGDQEGGREEKSAKNGEEEEDADEDAKPIGEPVRFSGKERVRRSHYEAFEYKGNQYKLEDSILLRPAETDTKPYIAIIKDIAQTNRSMMITAQWFYRPEEAKRKRGGSWQLHDVRELFYSFHQDEVPAESVMHKCTVHYLPIYKQFPDRKQNPGFVVQKVYDTGEKKLRKLTDKDYEDNRQHEIDLLLQRTLQVLGDLSDNDTLQVLGDLSENDTDDAHAD